MKMRTAILILALGTGFLQSVRAADCRCGVVCHCGDGGSATSEKPPPPRDGCCGEGTGEPVPAERPAGEPGCLHVEPSGEILPPDNLLRSELPAAAPLALPAWAAPPFGPYDKTDGAFCRIRGSPPLYLLHSVLLI